MKEADLHMHTRASDGTDTLEERIEDAEKKDLDTIAVTDHDKINGKLKQRSVTAENGIEVITGAEIKSEIEGNKIEILAYFINPEGEKIQKLLGELSRKRKARMKKFVNNLNQSYSLGLELEKILGRADGNVGRPHLAEALIDKGLVDSHQEAFDRFIGSEHDEYVPVDKVPAEEVIEKVQENGGATSLAHPGRSLEKEEAEDLVEKLAQKGLDGIEVDYTYDERRDKNSYNIKFGREKAERLADKFDLVKTGGSDCHGSRSEKYYLGKIRIPYSRVKDLKQKTTEKSTG